MTRLVSALLLAILALPLAIAGSEDTVGGDVSVNESREDTPEESTLGGLSSTVVIVLIVLAVLVVALVVAMASSRGP